MAEQLRLDEVFGNRRAIHLHEPLAAARAEPVNGPRHELFAHAALPLQEHRRVRRRRLADRFFHFLQSRAVADHLILRVDFLPQRAIGRISAIALELFLDPLEQNRLGERFLDEPRRALVARLKGVLRRAVARHHHHGDFGMPGLDLFEHFQPVHAWHLDIQKHEIGRIAIDEGESLRPEDAPMNW